MVIDRVMNTIEDHELIKLGDKVVLGLSGGPDSVCLLHVLNKLKKELNTEIYAAHLNHQIRGIEAQRDALYVSELCEKLGVLCFVKSVDIPKYCRDNGLSLEEGARKKRYEMFDEIKEKTGANKIAIGHNLNDQAETVLMRIMRGTGIEGLRGIEYIRDDCFIRPLLDIDRASIEKYCDDYKLNPRIDQTNLESVYTRNKIRLELIPYMKKNFNSNLIASIMRMSENVKNDDDFIKLEVKKVYEEILSLSKIDDGVEITLSSYYRNLHNAIKTRVLREIVKHILGDSNNIGQVHIDYIMSLEDDKKIDKVMVLPRGVFAYRKKDSIILTDKELVNDNQIEFCYNVPCNGYLKIKEIKMFIKTEIMSINRYKSIKLGKNSRCFDFNKIKGGLVVRNREQGDKIKLAIGNKKVKELFIDLKIPKEERNKVPIILDDGEVICVGDYRLSENYKISRDTREVLRITFNNL